MKNKLSPWLDSVWPDQYWEKEHQMHALNVSGGRTSAYMLHLFLDHFDGRLPHNLIVAFMNTGKEREETLDFIHTMETEWMVNTVWLEYRYDNSASGGLASPKNTFTVVDYETASRKGEPFEQLVIKGKHGYLPNVTERMCTHELKVNTLRRFMRKTYGLNRKQYQNILGIRHDERKRMVKLFDRECNHLTPLFNAKITKDDVDSFWSQYRFDLALPNNVLYTNCDLCFMKGRHGVERVMRREPERAEWWIDMEKRITEQRDNVPAKFIKAVSYSEIYELSQQPFLPFEEEEISFSCFCGD